MTTLPILLACLTPTAPQDGPSLADLPPEPEPALASVDWLIEPSPFRAVVARSRDGQGLVLTNGLVRRELRVAPNGATVALDDLVTGRAVLRAVRPEARVTLDGVEVDVGGLTGQPNHAFLRREWLDDLQADPLAMRLTGFAVGEPEAPFGWKRVRHADPRAAWPPRGVALRMDYALPADAGPALMLERAGQLESAVGRAVGFEEDFATLSDAWREHRSSAHERSSFTNEGKVGEIMTPANTACYVERALPPDTTLVEVTLDVGTDRSASWGPGLALVCAERTVKFHLRPGGGGYDGAPRFGAFDGERELDTVGGRVKLDVARPWTLRLRHDGAELHLEARQEGETWRHVHALDARGLGAPRALRVGKLDVRGGPGDHADPGGLVRLRVLRAAAYGPLDNAALERLVAHWEALQQVHVSVHYELYDGLPCLAKWITVHNGSERTVVVDRFTSELLAAVERESRVETRPEVPYPPPNLWVETDYATGGANENGQRWSVHWVTDPDYATQVNYLRQTPCLLECRPSVGPAQDVPPGGTLRSFRSFVLVHDSEDRARNGLARCRMYRTIAPWVTENPLMMHVRFADRESVERAIDQCAEVGFEMVILTFGSGFNMEDDSPEYLAQMRGYADYARARGVEIGGYSLLSSRRIGGGNDVVSPPGERPTHGSCPALTSAWGQEYYRKLHAFFPATGFSLLEHDGPYPGDFDVTPRPPLQKGYLDSQWVQFWIAADFYRWCRGEGIYLNTPDWYHLNGSTKSAMGYREVNWSLPRADQVLHTRQNIYDGTWTKTPSTGWMFVPLTEYHGGGPAATVEPLHEHLEHYRRMLEGNLGAGVQACYRGPQLYDTDETRALVAQQVAWFKEHRAILESDIDHGASRRADGRDLDWLLHVNPGLEEKGMLVVHNPLAGEVTRTLRLDLYYTGLREEAVVRDGSGTERRLALDRRFRVELPVTVPAGGMSWYAIGGR